MKHKVYKIGVSVVTNSRWVEHGDQAVDCTDPVGTIHRSGVHFCASQTRNTLPAVAELNRSPFGDHFRCVQGKPIRFNGVFRFLSTSHISISVSLVLAVANNVPFGFHSTDVIGKWFPLRIEGKNVGKCVAINQSVRKSLTFWSR